MASHPWPDGGIPGGTEPKSLVGTFGSGEADGIGMLELSGNIGGTISPKEEPGARMAKIMDERKETRNCGKTTKML
jgi:hypothetical protein